METPGYVGHDCQDQTIQTQRVSLQDIDGIKDIRGFGMLGAVELTAKGNPGALGTQAQKNLFWNGMHVKFTGDTGVVAPPFISEKAHIDEMIDKLRMTLEAL